MYYYVQQCYGEEKEAQMLMETDPGNVHGGEIYMG